MRNFDSESSAGETALTRGVAAARAGLRSVAASQFERAAENLPEDPNVWLWLAWVSNSPDNTIRCLERVLDLSPGHAVALAGLSWARGLAKDGALEPVAVAEPVASATPSVAIVTNSPAVDEPPTAVTVPNTATKTVSIETPIVVVETPVVTVAPLIPVSQVPETTVSSVVVVEPAPNHETSTEDNEGAPRRHWSDLVERDPSKAAEASAWPSLVPPPLPTMTPPPLPTIAVAAVQEHVEPVTRSRFHDIVSANSASREEPLSETVLVTESVADVEALTSSFNPPAVKLSPDGRPLVMVVDDSPTVRKLVSLTLERRGYRVISAFDGVAAIKELGSCHPDLILLDINMPRLDGYRLCKLIKKHEATQAIPVVMLSGKDGMFDKLRGRLVGCSDYITKPFEADALTHKVAKYLTSASSSL